MFSCSLLSPALLSVSLVQELFIAESGARTKDAKTSSGRSKPKTMRVKEKAKER